MHANPGRAFRILVLSLALVGASAAVTSAEVGPDEATALVAAHNQVRQTVAAAETARLGKQVTIPDLVWSPEAAAVAQAWADNLLATDTFEHNANRGPFGENIYWEFGRDPATSGPRAVSNWASEQADYTWDTNACSDVCGHYTQIVWANTTAVGCGHATDGNQSYWVCNYAPPGNWNGERPYEPGAAVAPAPSTAPVAPAPSTAPVAPAPSTAPVAPAPSTAPAEPPASTAPVAPAPSTAPEPSTAPAEPPASTAPVAGLSPELGRVLSAHNDWRVRTAASESQRIGQPVTIPQLTWNTEAAAIAQAWADNLLATGAFEHNPNATGLGENIYWESGMGADGSAQRAVDSWASEQADYTWETNSCASECGHWTQLVWAKTTSVGCGVATDGTQAYWVCDYAPPGNMQGERPYEIDAAQPPASTAPAEPSAAPVQPSSAPAEPSAAPAQPSDAPVEPSAAPVEPEPSLAAPMSPPPTASEVPAIDASLPPCPPIDPAASLDPAASPVPCVSPVPSEVPFASEAPLPSEPPVDTVAPSESPAA